MMYYTENREMIATKIKTEARQNVIDDIITMLGEKYGEDNVRMVRVGTSTSKKNELAIKVGKVSTLDGDKPLCVTLSVSAKPYSDSPASAKRPYTAFDFEEAARDYENYLDAKATKAAEAAARKN